MDRVTKILIKRLLLFSACSLGAMTLLVLAFSRGFLSPRGLGIALLIMCVAIGSVAIIKKSAKEFAILPGTSIDDTTTRKRRLLGIRAGKAMIALLALTLVLGLFRGGPLAPVLVGIAVNLAMMLSLIWWVLRLQRSLH
jgi:hypothetical protein